MKHDNEQEPERRSLSWALMMVLVLLTLGIAVLLAYLIVVHNFPHTR